MASSSSPFYVPASSSSSSSRVTQEQFKQFHSIDRQLFTILVIQLCRDSMESMQIMALWLWLESLGYRKVVEKMVSLPFILISELADEAVTCLSIINGTFFALPFEASDIPLTKTFMQKEISLQFFHEKQQAAAEGIHNASTTICFPAFHDILRYGMERNFAQAQQPQQPQHPQPLYPSPSPSPSSLPSSSTSIQPQNHRRHQQQQPPPLVPPTERTMFMTFSKGYPVNEHEVKHFFNTTYGECVESLQMQEVRPFEQSLFARVVFNSLATVEAILEGTSKAKFTINGKHIWLRRFVPRHSTRPALLPHPMASQLPTAPFDQ